MILNLRIKQFLGYILIFFLIWNTACVTTSAAYDAIDTDSSEETEADFLAQTTSERDVTPISPPQPVVLNSIEDAQAKVSFQILIPSAETLPDGLQLSGIDWWPLNKQNVEGITLHYSMDGREWLQITQHTSEAGGSPTGGASYTVVDIRGRHGYFVPDLRLTNSLNQNLFWYEDGLFINLVGTLHEEMFDSDDILAIANGLNSRDE